MRKPRRLSRTAPIEVSLHGTCIGSVRKRDVFSRKYRENVQDTVVSQHLENRVYLTTRGCFPQLDHQQLACHPLSLFFPEIRVSQARFVCIFGFSRRRLPLSS